LPFLVKNELFWSRFQLICSSIYPVTTLLFILEYPKKILNLNTNKIIYFFVPSLISIYLATTKLYIIDVVDNKTLVPGPLYNIFLSVFLIYFAVIIGIAIYGSITFDKKSKTQIRFFLFALSISLTFASITNLFLPSIGVLTYIDLGPICATFFIIINIYILLKYDFLNIKFLVSNFVANALTLILFSTAYIAINWGILTLLQSTSLILTFSISLLFLIISLPNYKNIKILLQSNTEKYFLKGIYDYNNILKQFAQYSAKSKTTNELVEYIYKLFIEEIEILPVNIFIPEWFDKFKDISKNLVFTKPKKLESINQEINFSESETKKIEKSRKRFMSKSELEKMGIKSKPNLKYIINCFDQDQNLIGLITLGEKMTSDKYNKKDIDLFITLSEQISIALLRIKELRLSTQIEIAQKLQLEILPQINQIPNCDTAAYIKSSDEVGGDFYDIHKRGNEHWIILGDVAGHGIGSGMIMLMIQSIFSTIIHSSKLSDPAEINKIANKILCKHFERLTEPRPISLVTLYTKDGKNFLVHGNHENVYIFNKKENAVNHIPILDIPLGIGLTAELDDSCFTSKSLKIDSEDVLLLTTDGLTEAYKNGNINNEQYNDDRVIHLLKENAHQKTEDLKEKIIKSLNKFTNKIYQDDVTFIIIKSQKSNEFTTLKA
tara:strand:- start:217 stop:2208 length:1992 start_codon:yes stop_codon:yes gene_type:complete